MLEPRLRKLYETARTLGADFYEGMEEWEIHVAIKHAETAREESDHTEHLKLMLFTDGKFDTDALIDELAKLRIRAGMDSYE
jgi:hypothetical protein